MGLVIVPALSFFIPLYALLAIILAALLLLRRGCSRARYPLLLALGLLINTGQVQSLCRAQLAPKFDSTWQSLEFKIVSIPQQNSRSTLFLADVRKMECTAAACPPSLVPAKTAACARSSLVGTGQGQAPTRPGEPRWF
jgi:hypothetical protein